MSAKDQEPFDYEKHDAHYVQPFINRSHVRALVWDKTGGKCWYCGTQTNPWRNFCIDHIIPNCDEIENVVPCCNKCNVRKGSNTIEDFRRKYKIAEFYFESRGFFI